jgi:hypothetical protein
LDFYLLSDIFGLRNETESHNVIEFLQPINEVAGGNAQDVQAQSFFQQSLVRLMNAMASVKSGRDYLGN